MKVKLGKYPKGEGNRKIDIHIERFDTWNLDHTLALIIYPALIQLRDTKHGVPNDFAVVGGEDYNDQLCFDFYKDEDGSLFDKKCSEWDDVLDKMIWSFAQLVKEDYDAKYHHGTPKFDWIKTNEKILNPITGKMEDTFKMVDKNPDEHWYDSVGHLMHEERIQEGLELFGKYYRSLWD
jgi:hypothetical protein